MAYTSLYRRYRPDTFEGVIGQDHIVRTLKNQLASGNIGHAYIFTGTRGTGKTSVAKIFARAVNCLHPIEGSPCGECECCRELAKPNNFDIIEMDAASNNSVEDIRSLIEKIGFAPTVGKYKVYIVDEVHMLSAAAFNALLKTLEEPPAHAIFILATTEIHKIPATILSRCLRFDFRLVPAKLIADRIRFIFDDIGIKYQPEAVELIASSGGGSVRDALSLADMCVSYCDGNVTYDGVLEVLGASDPERLRALAMCIAEGDVNGALKEVSALCDLGKNVTLLANDLTTLFRNVLYIKHCEGAAREMLALPENVYDGLKQLADKYSVPRCLGIMKAFSKLEGELRYSSQRRILFEASVVQACYGDENSKTDELAARVARLEKIVSALKKPGFNQAPAIMDARQVWIHIASKLNAMGYALLASGFRDVKMEMTDTEFVICVPDVATKKLLEVKSNADAIKAAAENTPEAGGRRVVFKEEQHVAKDTALPYVQDMFGAYLDVK